MDHVIERRTRFNPGRHLVKVAISPDSKDDAGLWPVGAEAPRVVLTYNQSIGFLLKARLDWNQRRLRLPEPQVYATFNEWLFRRGVYKDRWWTANQDNTTTSTTSPLPATAAASKAAAGEEGLTSAAASKTAAAGEESGGGVAKPAREPPAEEEGPEMPPPVVLLDVASTSTRVVPFSE